MGKLEGKVAVITGGATGIGRAAAKRFIEEGAFVFIFGRRQEALDAAVAELGPNVRAVTGSVSDEADLDRLYAAVKAARGTLDIVFANAGVGSQLRLGEITAKHIDETFDVNVKGTIFTVQKALPLMGKGGSIILTGSSAGTTGAPAFTAYSASKAAVRNLARTWAEDLKGTGIRVNVLSPDPIANTPNAGKTVRRRFTDIWKNVDGVWKLEIRHRTDGDRSLLAQRRHRIQATGSLRGQPHRDERHSGKQQRDRREDCWIAGSHAEQKA